MSGVVCRDCQTPVQLSRDGRLLEIACDCHRQSVRVQTTTPGKWTTNNDNE